MTADKIEQLYFTHYCGILLVLTFEHQLKKNIFVNNVSPVF